MLCGAQDVLANRMYIASFVTRVLAAIISALYMIALLPHALNIPKRIDTYNSWTIFGFIISALWIPTVLSFFTFRRESNKCVIYASFFPIAIEIIFILALFYGTMVVR